MTLESMLRECLKIGVADMRIHVGEQDGELWIEVNPSNVVDHPHRFYVRANSIVPNLCVEVNPCNIS